MHYPREVSFKTAFLFPLHSKESCLDILTGGLLLLCWPLGWILNMGHRLDTVSRLYHNTPPYCRGFLPFEDTFNRGITALKTITLYTFPGYFLMGVACLWRLNDQTFQPGWLLILGLILLAIGILLLPGCMTVYAVERNPEILKRPVLAFQWVWRHRVQYFKAWLIALTGIMISFLGFIPIGIGWLFTSVWAWEVVGYVFTISLYNAEELPG